MKVRIMVQTHSTMKLAEETNVDPTEEGPELGDLVCLPSMFNQETVIEDPNFVCAANYLCQSVGNQISIISICINSNLSAHHFCAKYLSEQSPVGELFYIMAKDFTKEGKICDRKITAAKIRCHALYPLPVLMESN